MREKTCGLTDSQPGGEGYILFIVKKNWTTLIYVHTEKKNGGPGWISSLRMGAFRCALILLNLSERAW